MRTLYDAVTASNIPASAQLVAGYVDGRYKWSAADWDRFPHAVKIRIAVFSSTDDGHVLDCEQGNATPPQSVDWVLLRRAAGADPTVYCGRNTWWSQIRDCFTARGVPQPHYWVADYSVNQADPQVPAPALALQYANVGPYDLSIAPDYWPGVDAPPPPPPPVEPEMILLTGMNGTDVYGLSGSLYWHVADGPSVAAYRTAGVPEVGITPKEHESILAAVAASQPPNLAGEISATLTGTGSLKLG